MNIKWDADKYTSSFSFVHKYGNDLLKMIDIKENMTALDLGCGNGALTKKLCDMGIKASGIDASSDMIKQARAAYPDIKFTLANAESFALDEKIDIVLSNAVFHWINKENQSKMLKCVYNALKENGQFIFEFGGYGNNALIHSALKAEFEANGFEYIMPFYFPTVCEYSALIENAGFTVVYTSLFDRNTELQDDNGLADWIRMFVKKPFENIPEKDISAIITNTVHKLKDKLYVNGKWYADYVRIRFKAIKK